VDWILPFVSKQKKKICGMGTSKLRIGEGPASARNTRQKTSIAPCFFFSPFLWVLSFYNPSRYYNSITNLKFRHKPKYHLSKILKP
jgi:hypothetical protein